MRKSFVVLLPLALWAVAGNAQDGDAIRGAALYDSNCGACHGPGGQGDGPMTRVLSIIPADLTALAAVRGYGLAEIVRRIDGRDVILAHGGPMPLFGNLLGGDSAVLEDGSGDPVFTSRDVLDIASYLMTLQK